MNLEVLHLVKLISGKYLFLFRLKSRRRFIAFATVLGWKLHSSARVLIASVGHDELFSYSDFHPFKKYSFS